MGPMPRPLVTALLALLLSVAALSPGSGLTFAEEGDPLPAVDSTVSPPVDNPPPLPRGVVVEEPAGTFEVESSGVPASEEWIYVPRPPREPPAPV